MYSYIDEVKTNNDNYGDNNIEDNDRRMDAFVLLIMIIFLQNTREIITMKIMRMMMR